MTQEAMSNNTLGLPDQRPPVELSGEAGGAGTTEPTLTDEQLAAMAGMQASAPAPTLTPPTSSETAAAAEAEAVAATWRANVYIDGMWSIDEVRNAFCYVRGVGWRKLYNGRDGAFQALVTLASQARQTNRPVTLREESDGMIYAIYLW